MKTLRPKPMHATVDSNLNEALRANEVLHKKIKEAEVCQSLIEIKKDRQKLFEERRPLFLMIGLSLSLLISVIVFNWKTYDNTNLVDLGQVDNDFDEIIEVPPSLQLPPPPPKKLEVFQIKEVDDQQVIEEVDLDLDVEVIETMQVVDVVYEPEFEEVEEVAEEIFQIVEDQPTFPGGISKFYEYVGNNMEYPSMARRLNVSGRVFVRFVIEKDGSLTDIQVVKGIGAGCDEEAIRVLSSSPKWTPGRQRGKNVRVYMTVPILFVLKEN